MRQPSVVDGPLAVDLADSRGDVALRGRRLRLLADGPLVLEDLNLHLEPGETVAMVGRTASGKTTVARLLSRFYDVTGGAVRIDGHDVRDVTIESLRHQVGVVLDEPFLFSVSIRDNIAYGRPDASLEEIQAAARAAGRRRVHRAAPDGYDTIVGERGYTLSGGQRQRIAIARTLLVNPPILVLDDATSAVDVQVEQEIHEGLRTLMRGPHDADRRAPPVDDRAGRPRRAARRRHGSSPTAPTPSCSRARRCTSRCSPRPRPRSASSCGSSASASRTPQRRRTGCELRRLRRRLADVRWRRRRRARRAGAAAPGGGCRSPGSRPSCRRASTSCSPSEPEYPEPSAQFSYRSDDERAKHLTLRQLVFATGVWV